MNSAQIVLALVFGGGLSFLLWISMNDTEDEDEDYHDE